MSLENELILRDLYYSPKTGYRSAKHLYELAKEENSDITLNFVKTWLRHQDAFTKYKRYSNPSHFRHTFVRDLGEQIQVDLVVLLKHKEENDGFAYILMAIEILSRFAFAVPLLRKDGKTTLEGLKLILEQFRKKFHDYPKRIQWDEGGEFLNKETRHFLQEKNVQEFSTASVRKATIVERLNRTIKEKMQKLFTHEKSHRWVTHLDDLITNYNTQENRGIGMKPIEVNEGNKWLVFDRLFGHIVTFDTPKYKVGDYVRLLHFTPSYKGKTFQAYYRKKYPPRKKEGSKRPARDVALSARDKSPFSDEIFKVVGVYRGDPIVYKLFSEEADVEILGKFYESELSLVNK